MASLNGWQLKQDHYTLGDKLTEEKKVEIITELFREQVGYELNLENPRSFNEKIIWYKLFYQDPRMTECADKYTVKNYVSRTIGSEHIVPTIATWTDPDDIDFSLLPDSFVLKVNWSSGYYIIVKDKSKIDEVAVRKKLKTWMEPARNSYFEHFNWAYKHMEPVVFAEEYLEQSNGQVYDYKYFICGGELGFTLIVTDRKNRNTTGTTMDYFDENFNHYDLKRAGSENANPPLEKPEHYDEMVDLAKKLAEPFPFVRVDFYDLDGRILLGEMTFYTAGGLKPFEPTDWDYTLGAKIPLPEKLITDIPESVKDAKESKKSADKPHTAKSADTAKKTAAAKSGKSVKKADAANAAKPAKKADAANAAKPVNKADAAAKPAKKADAANAAKPVKKADAAAAAKPVKKADTAAAAKPVKKADAANAAKPVKKADAANAAKPVKKADAANAAKPVKTAETASSKSNAAAVPAVKKSIEKETPSGFKKLRSKVIKHIKNKQGSYIVLFNRYRIKL